MDPDFFVKVACYLPRSPLPVGHRTTAAAAARRYLPRRGKVRLPNCQPFPDCQTMQLHTKIVCHRASAHQVPGSSHHAFSQPGEPIQVWLASTPFRTETGTLPENTGIHSLHNRCDYAGNSSDWTCDCTALWVHCNKCMS